MKDVSLITNNQKKGDSKKQFTHVWTEDFFLLHIQLNNPDSIEADVLVTRYFDDGNQKSETVKLKKDMKSHRFMISRSHPKEKRITVDYTPKLELEAFKVDDRAFYPAKPFFKG